MDDQEFRRRLSEVAEWHIPKTVDRALDGRRRRGRPSIDEEDQDINNITVPPQLIKIKTQPQVCEDCHKICDQPRNIESRCFEEVGIRHWRTRCLSCNLYRHPDTNEFTLNPSNSTMYFRQWCKQIKKKLAKPSKE